MIDTARPLTPVPLPAAQSDQQSNIQEYHAAHTAGAYLHSPDDS